MLNNSSKSIIITRLNHTWYGRILKRFGKYIVSRDPFSTKLKIENKGSLRIKKEIIGKDNLLVIGKGACLDKVSIKIQGNNNVIHIGENTIIGSKCRLYLFGNNLELRIGNNCTFSHDDEILVQEDNSKIIIGNDCMFSHHINVRTSDAHPIFYTNTNERANPAKNILIGNHVWVGAHVIIQKGSIIGNNCVIATYSIVNHKIITSENHSKDLQNCHNCIIAGMPAKVVKSGIDWKRSF